jgi:hypothetical protein
MDGFYWTANKQQEIVKDPDAILDYTFPWADWLDTDTISSAAITIADSDTLALASSSDHAQIPAAGYTISGGNTVIVWLKGGAVRDRAAVTCAITTAGGRTDERTFYVRVAEK